MIDTLEKGDNNKIMIHLQCLFLCALFLERFYSIPNEYVSVACCPFLLMFETDINEFIHENICVNSADSEISMQ